MIAPNVTFWTKNEDLELLFRADRIAYLVGGYDGYCNYGDVLQLASTVRRANTISTDMLAVPLLHYPMLADHEELVRLYPDLFGEFCPLYYSLPSDRARPEASDALKHKLGRLTDAPSCYSQVTVYGGGFFNNQWGAKKLQVIDALNQWGSSASRSGAGPHRLIAVGQQVSAGFLESSEEPEFRRLLERADAIGLRDTESFMALARRYPSPIAEKLFVSGDDAVPIFIDKRGIVAPNSGRIDAEAARPFIVNVHLNLEDYVTDNPIRHIGAALTLLRQIDVSCRGNMVVNLVVAYEDSRISESRYLARLCGELGWPDSRFRSVNCLADLADGFKALRSGDLTVASSYHVALTSLLLSVPTVLLHSNEYYRHKAQGLQCVFQLPDLLFVDVGQARDDGLAETASRLVDDVGLRMSLRAKCAQGAATFAIVSANTTATLARFWSEGYQAELRRDYQTASDKLVETMQQLSDLQFEYERLLNATKRIQGQGRSGKAGDYVQLVSRIRRCAEIVLPIGAKTLVVSRGGEELLKLGEREGWHFPQNRDGIYAGYHPANSDAAITHLEELRARGADYLLLPSTAFWWLEHYEDFRKYLESHYLEVFRQDDACAVYALNQTAQVESIDRRIRVLEHELASLRTTSESG